MAEAIPALQSAVAALNTLDPADITVVKTMKNPATIIRLVVEAVCVMKGVAPDRKPDLEKQVVEGVFISSKKHDLIFPSSLKGRLIDDYWAPGQKMMGDIKFLDTLKVGIKIDFLPLAKLYGHHVVPEKRGRSQPPSPMFPHYHKTEDFENCLCHLF